MAVSGGCIMAAVTTVGATAVGIMGDITMDTGTMVITMGTDTTTEDIMVATTVVATTVAAGVGALVSQESSSRPDIMMATPATTGTAIFDVCDTMTATVTSTFGVSKSAIDR
jgi:hypothetical protein